jgi:hypothetical protein
MPQDSRGAQADALMALLARWLHTSMIARVTLVGIVFTGLTVAKTYPLIRHFDTLLPGAFGDPVLVTWILAWGSHALTTDPWNLFNANIFYPLQNTLALSEHMVSVVPFFAPVYLLTGNPIVAYNSVFCLSFILCGMTMFLLVYHWTENFWASLLSGCLFAFAPIRFAEIYHLQLYNFYWAPLVFLFLEKFFWSKRWRHLAGFAIFYWLQVLCSVYLGWLTTVAVGVYISYHVIFVNRGLLSRTIVPGCVAFVITTLLVLLPFHVPYYTLQNQWGFSTTLQECIDWSADLVLNYLSPPHMLNNLYLALIRVHWPALAHPSNQQTLFPGLVLGFLAVMGGLPVAIFPLGRGSRHLPQLFGLVLVSSLLLSLGPFLVILGQNTSLPLPYLLFYYLVPGFQAIRVPARFALMAVLAASVLAALGFLKASDFLHRQRGLRQVEMHLFQAVFMLCCIGLFTVELGFKPISLGGMPTGPQVPGVYRWLATKQQNGPIIELPLGEDYREALKYMYFSTYHWLPLVNGASRFLPPPHVQLSAELADFPSRQGAELISGMGVKVVVVHTDRLDPHAAARWRNANLAEIGLEEVARFDADVVYKLSPAPETHALHVELAVPDQLSPEETVQLPRNAMLRLRLLGKSGGHSLWTPPSLPGRIQARIEWEEEHTGERLIQRRHVELPLAIRAEETWSTILPVKAPASPAQYTVRVILPALGVKTATKHVRITPSRYPQSANSPRLLSAEYLLEAPASEVITSGAIDVALEATNTGRIVWPATARNDRGEVRLGWRWFRGQDEGPLKEEGREHLQYDVFPGQSYRFKTTINPPSVPGEYTLELGLVSELVTWFSDQGVPPLRLAVRVEDTERLASP